MDHTEFEKPSDYVHFLYSHNCSILMYLLHIPQIFGEDTVINFQLSA